MGDQNTKNKKSKKILDKYLETFPGEHLPPLLMMQCFSMEDKRYLAMCERAIKRGTPVTEDDLEEFFPLELDEDGENYLTY